MTEVEAVLREAMVRLREIEVRIAALEALVGSGTQIAALITPGRNS